MENNSNNTAKTRTSFSEAVNNKNSPVKENQCHENRRELDHTKRDRGRDVACNGNRASFNKRGEDSLDKDNKVLREEQLVVRSVQQTSIFPPFDHNSIDHLALARDDQYDFDKEASHICEKLKNEETSTLAASILINWLEKGECTKENASSFFSMIQSTYCKFKKLQLELDKGKYEDQLIEAKNMLKKQLGGIIRQFSEVEKIYKAASLQKCWDQFSKGQRKNIEMWKRQTEELKNALLEEVICQREDEEMELSDDENSDKTNTDSEQVRKQYQEDVHKYQEEAYSLRCQLEAAQNEIMVMQSDNKEELDRKDNQLATMRQALQNSKYEELNLSKKRSENESELKELRAFKCRMMEENPDCVNDSAYENNSHLGSLSNANIERETHLIGLISTFLHVHPFGANVDYICSYLNQIGSTIESVDVENLLKRYPMIFKENSTGIGATLEKKWHFTAF